MQGGKRGWEWRSQCWNCCHCERRRQGRVRPQWALKGHQPWIWNLEHQPKKGSVWIKSAFQWGWGEAVKHFSAKVLQAAPLPLLVVQQSVNKPVLHTALCDLEADHFPSEKLIYSDYSPKRLEAACSLHLTPSLCSAAPQSSWFNSSKKQSRSLLLLYHFSQYCWQNNSDDNITDCNQMQWIHYKFHLINYYFALAFLDAFRSNKSINEHSKCLLFQCWQGTNFVNCKCQSLSLN